MGRRQQQLDPSLPQQHKLAGYAPDLPGIVPGVVTVCTAMVPSMKGLKGAPAPTTVTGLPALAAACRGSAAVRKLDSTSRLFAGTATALYEASSSAWNDKTRAAGGAYALGSDLRWRFAQYGDTTIAAAKSEILQFSASGSFANVAATSPKAAIVETFDNFVLLCDVNDQGALYDSADRPNGWWVCKRGDYTNWTPSVANECATGTITSSPGKILAARRFGAGAVLYKERAMYSMQYVGQPQIVDVQEIPGTAGAPSQEAVVVVGTPDNPRHIFMGFDNFYSFDGSRPVPIGNPLKETVFGELNKTYAYACCALHDSINSRIYFFYPTLASVTPDKCVVYNYRTGMWGRDDRTIEMVVEYLASGITWDELGTSYSTWHDLPSLSWDTAFFQSGFPTPAIFNTSHTLQTLTGASVSSSITTGDIGTDDFVSFVSRLWPTFLTRPTSATLTPFYKMSLGDSYTQGTSVSMDSLGRFDFFQSARWHKFAVDFSGPVELPQFSMESQFDGYH